MQTVYVITAECRVQWTSHPIRQEADTKETEQVHPQNEVIHLLYNAEYSGHGCACVCEREAERRQGGGREEAGRRQGRRPRRRNGGEESREGEEEGNDRESGH